MKIVEVSTRAKTYIGLTKYIVRFSCEAGDVEISLQGDIARQVQVAVEAIPPEAEARRITTALAILADLGFGLSQ
jgi:hypothetical protein